MIFDSHSLPLDEILNNVSHTSIMQSSFLYNNFHTIIPDMNLSSVWIDQLFLLLYSLFSLPILFLNHYCYYLYVYKFHKYIFTFSLLFKLCMLISISLILQFSFEITRLFTWHQIYHKFFIPKLYLKNWLNRSIVNRFLIFSNYEAKVNVVTRVCRWNTFYLFSSKSFLERKVKILPRKREMSTMSLDGKSNFNFYIIDFIVHDSDIYFY